VEADEENEPGAMVSDGASSNQGIGARPSRRGFGVLGALPHGIIQELARAAESAGYHTFWVNDAPDGDGLVALSHAAAVTSTIRLGVGAIPLDRQGPERIAMRLVALELPVERLTLGVGSGHAAGGLDRVRAGVAALRAATDATLVVAAMGPRMCRLAGEIADGVLLDWATPTYAQCVRDIVAGAAGEAGRPRPWTASYVYSALGAEATGKLHAEADYYAAIPSYSTHFARMNAGPMDAVAFGHEPVALRHALARFDAVLDETDVRAVVAEEITAAYLAMLQAASPLASF
jgi:alkanesulfonate monooxygenase SsuD/methylene tetrahydromethanopterin reductase-like flavin-dependent oxidoreductase (luciferase family)